MNYQALWNYFVKTSFITGRIIDENGEEKQAAYSLYTAFYEKHDKYSELNNDLIKGFFGERELQFTEENNLDNTISATFGENALSYIKSRPINSDQQQALKNGLVQPVALVQGPPGTGKTEMILNFLAVVTKLAPNSKIAVVSCNAEALKNITDALEERKELAINSGDPNNIMVETCRRCAILGNKRKRQEWSANVDSDYISDRFKCIFKNSLLNVFPIFTSTIHSLAKIFDSYPEHFDYVIIDECSQVSVSLGLVAMAHAEHLMLVGDNLQLQAIIDQRASDRTKKEDDTVKKYLEEENKSFLKTCENLFPNAPNIMLRDHYRCHPSIANFCNKYVYGGNLTVKTYTLEEEKNDCRIDIMWYDGAYMEDPALFFTDEIKNEYKEIGPLDNPRAKKSTDSREKSEAISKKLPSQKNNFHQIEIFMKEMLPDLKKKMKENPANPPTVCVLAPFRLQLQLLKERLEKELLDDKELCGQVDLQMNEDDKSQSQDEELPKGDNPNLLQSLSIHKSQGKGYDIVYLMTVEDNIKKREEPWGQSMRIINVAVSRAKKEFHVITSRTWIPQYIQKKLPEISDLKMAPMPNCIRNKLKKGDDDKEKAFYNNPTQGEINPKDNFYIGRLCQWVYDKFGAKEQSNKFGKFGFRKAKTSSIFDSCIYDIEPDYHNAVKNALLLIRPDLKKEDIKTHASLRNAVGLTEKLKNISKLELAEPDEEAQLTEDDFNTKDFIFILKDNYIKAIIHVIDKKYRDACLPQYGFYRRLKRRMDKAYKALYTEIPTNGGLENEINEILKNYDNSSRLVFEENAAIKLLTDKTAECLDAVSEILYDDGRFKLGNTRNNENKEILEALGEVNYTKPENVEYSQSDLSNPLLMQQYYLCRYGTAYAFEYAMMYDIVFRCAKTKNFDILSLGCGSCIDALAAEYSRERLKNEIKLTYKGVDRVKWDVSFFDDIKESFAGVDFVEQDIAEYFEKNNIIQSNVIFLPKILNELGDESREELLKAAQKCRLDPKVEEYYFCISHSNTHAEENSDFAQKLIKGLGNSGKYTCNSFFDLDNNESFRSMWGLKEENTLTNDNGIYRFNEQYADEIAKFNGEFSDSLTDAKMNDIVINLKKINDSFRHRIKKVNEIAFQIICLKK